MLKRKQRIPDMMDLMTKDYTCTKVKLSFATKAAGTGYDPYEENLTLTNLNPKTIKAYIHAVTPQQLLYKQYGLSNIGALEIICDSKYLDWFLKANKIEIDNKEYRVLSQGNADGTLSNPKASIVSERCFHMCKVVLVRAN